MKNKFGFILIKPQLGENIGATARSLKNFGFKNLILTSPRDGWPNIKAKATSVDAFDILKKTKVLSSTKFAVKNFDIIFSFSARKRDINKKHINMINFLKILKNVKFKKIGFMFGPEASGLTNYDLSFSNYIVQIPSSPKFKSLNLSHSHFFLLLIISHPQEMEENPCFCTIMVGLGYLEVNVSIIVLFCFGSLLDKVSSWFQCGIVLHLDTPGMRCSKTRLQHWNGLVREKTKSFTMWVRDER